jgi:hypothetical protein
MDGLAILSKFITFVGDTLADLKRREVADIDLELLGLKRRALAEKLAEAETELQAEVTRKQGAALQDLITRGLANSTVKDSVFRGIERDASSDLEKMAREHGRATEEIALLERKLRVESQAQWRRFLRWCGNLSRYLRST